MDQNDTNIISITCILKSRYQCLKPLHLENNETCLIKAIASVNFRELYLIMLKGKIQ
jgi:hypothetical protein